jgi:hypothetical protein
VDPNGILECKLLSKNAHRTLKIGLMGGGGGGGGSTFVAELATVGSCARN